MRPISSVAFFFPLRRLRKLLLDFLVLGFIFLFLLPRLGRSISSQASRGLVGFTSSSAPVDSIATSRVRIDRSVPAALLTSTHVGDNGACCFLSAPGCVLFVSFLFVRLPRHHCLSVLDCCCELAFLECAFSWFCSVSPHVEHSSDCASRPRSICDICDFSAVA